MVMGLSFFLVLIVPGCWRHMPLAVQLVLCQTFSEYCSYYDACDKCYISGWIDVNKCFDYQYEFVQSLTWYLYVLDVLSSSVVSNLDLLELAIRIQHFSESIYRICLCMDVNRSSSRRKANYMIFPNERHHQILRVFPAKNTAAFPNQSCPEQNSGNNYHYVQSTLKTILGDEASICL